MILATGVLVVCGEIKMSVSSRFISYEAQSFCVVSFLSKPGSSRHDFWQWDTKPSWLLEAGGWGRGFILCVCVRERKKFCYPKANKEKQTSCGFRIGRRSAGAPVDDKD